MLLRRTTDTVRARVVSARDIAAFLARNLISTRDLGMARDITVDLDQSWPLFGIQPDIVDRELPATVRMRHGTMMTSPSTNLRLPEWDALIEQRPTAYRLPHPLTRWAPSVLLTAGRGRTPYNQECVRLDSDIDDASVVSRSAVALRRARYFDGLCSNMLTRYNIRCRGEPIDFRHQYLLDADTVIPLRHSQLANLVGVSTLAITRDNHLVLPHQAETSMSSPRLLAPSGSGSLEPHDIGPTAAQTFRCGAERELREECGLRPHQIAGSALIGFGRWLEYGAKPEFIALTALNIDSTEIEPMPLWTNTLESRWTDRVDTAPLNLDLEINDPYRYPESVTAAVSGNSAIGNDASMPLEFGLRCLTHTLAHRPQILADLRSTPSSTREEHP